MSTEQAEILAIEREDEQRTWQTSLRVLEREAVLLGEVRRRWLCYADKGEGLDAQVRRVILAAGVVVELGRRRWPVEEVA